MIDLAEFVRERDEALASCDLERVNAYAAKYGGPKLPDNVVGWAAIHKARTGILSLPEPEKQKSRDWLAAHDMEALG